MLFRGNAISNQEMRSSFLGQERCLDPLEQEGGTEKKKCRLVQMGEAYIHTLRVSEKRRPSCKDMSSVMEAASWMWEETDDGDIAPASMGQTGS